MGDKRKVPVERNATGRRERGGTPRVVNSRDPSGHEESISFRVATGGRVENGKVEIIS